MLNNFTESQESLCITDGLLVLLAIEPFQDSWPNFGCSQNSCCFTCHGASSLSRWRMCQYKKSQSLSVSSYIYICTFWFEETIKNLPRLFKTSMRMCVRECFITFVVIALKRKCW